MVCSPVANPIFTMQPLSPTGWWIALHVHVELHLPLSHGLPLSIQCFQKCDDTLHSACTRSTHFYSRCPSPVHYFHASWLHVNDIMRHHEAVAAGCVSQKSRCTMVYSRIMKCQISYLRRNQYMRHLWNDVRTIIYPYIYLHVYIDSADVVRNRWDSLRLTPIITVTAIFGSKTT